MNALLDLARPEIRELRPYRSAQFQAGLLRLNANESPWRPAGDRTEAGLNRYPEPRPTRLAAALAGRYGVDPENLLVTRGSSEAIDLLIRCFCRAGRDQVIICPPTFGMYEVYAQVQGAEVVPVPLRRDAGFALDIPAIDAAWSETTKLVFVCSPNNPTGNCMAAADLEALCRLTAGRGLVVIDGAYAEFAATDPTPALREAFEHVVVLRTLSKAAGLAGARCGVALAAPAVIDLLGCILPPFSYPAPAEEAVMTWLGGADDGTAGIGRIRAERDRLAEVLDARPEIRRVWPSDANFLLVEADNAGQLVENARRGGVLLRDFSWDPYLANGIRITVGSPEQNARLLAALDGRTE